MMEEDQFVEALARGITPTVLKYVSDYEEVPPEHIWTRPRYEWLSFAMVQIAKAALDTIRETHDIVPREPTKAMLRAYWKSMPSPYELDMEGDASALRHLSAIIEAGEVKS
ncbi:MAG: hypothetical protein NUV75_00600 [Gallionella sp.]|nr:hypothetical protein [Gallionella sp.]